MKKLISLFGIVLLLTTFSCDLEGDDTNFEFVRLQAIDAEFPESFQLGKVYKINVKGILPDGCTNFKGFDITRPSRTDRDVVMVGVTYSDDRACTQATEEITTSFNFEVLYEDPYYFRIWAGTDTQGNNLYLEYEIPVVP